MRRRFSWLLTILFYLLGFVLLALAILPFAPLKHLADGLMPDGEFETLTPANHIIFQALLVAGSAAFFVLAALTFLGRWLQVRAFFRQLGKDAIASLRGLRLSKGELPSLALLLVLTVIAVLYRLEYIYSSLHHDEAYTYMAFAHSLGTAIRDYHLPNNHVFHSVLVYLSTQAFGNAPWAVRLPAFAAGVLIVPAIYALGRRHYDRWVGLGAALLTAVSPALINYSDNARGYTLETLFGLLLLLLAHSVRASKNRFHWLLITLVSALGMYTLPVFLFPFGIAYLWMLWENVRAAAPGYASRRDFLTWWLASGLSAAALTLILYLPILLFTGPAKLFANEFVSAIPWPDYPETLAHRLAETWAEWTFRVPWPVVALLAAGLTLSLLLHKKISSTRVPLQAAAATWILLLLVVQRPNAWSKVWVFLLPLALLWAAAGLLGWAGKHTWKSLPISSVLVLLAILPFAWRAAHLAPELPDLWAMRGDEENAVLFVQEHLQGADFLVVAPPDDAPVWYYAELHGLRERVYGGASAFDRLFVLVNPAEGQTPATVLAERGPALSEPPSCEKLEEIGKIHIFVCRVNP